MSNSPKRKVRVCVGDVEVCLKLPESGEGSLPQAEWLPFSPTEARVVCLLLAGKALSREEIAAKLDESPDGRLRGILATLVARKVLVTGADGYSVNAPEGRRKALKEWFREPEEQAG